VSGHFEIHVKSGSRWSFHSFKPSEGEATSEARQLLKQKIADEVKVIQRVKNDEEKIIYNEDQNSVKKKAGLGHIETAPMCTKVTDLFSMESRKTMGILLRDYFDQTVLTPSELLHYHRSLEKFCDSSMFSSTLDRIAALQAVKAGMNEQERRDELYDLVMKAQDYARRGGRDEIQNNTLNDYINDAGSLDDAKTRFRIMVSLSQATMRSPSWEGKFIVLFELLGDVEPKDLHEIQPYFLMTSLAKCLGYPPLFKKFSVNNPIAITQ